MAPRKMHQRARWRHWMHGAGGAASELCVSFINHSVRSARRAERRAASPPRVPAQQRPLPAPLNTRQANPWNGAFFPILRR